MVTVSSGTTVAPRTGRECGFSLLELMIVAAIFALLSAIAVPAYSGYVQNARYGEVIAQFAVLENQIDRYVSDAGELPDSLADLGGDVPVDPWGNPYQYLRIDGADLKGKGSLRKDKNLVPINSDYDLYSMGPDGASTAPLTAKASRDDIVRANNGGYHGRAEDY